MQTYTLSTSMFWTSMAMKTTMKISASHALRRDARTIWMRSLVSQLTRGVSRREAVGVAALLFSNPALSLPPQEAKDSEIVRYRKLESGVKIQDIIEGEGPEAHEGDLVEFNYVCRRSNGYFVHSVLTPYYKEDVLYSEEELKKENEDGISTVFYLQKIYPDEWKNFLERIEYENRENFWKEKMDDLRHWVSYRSQTLARTVRGMMYYRRALQLQCFLDTVKDRGMSFSPDTEALFVGL